MNTDTCFASQGQIVHFAFDAFGLLPIKGCREEYFTETSKKSFQKLLKRLENEKGLLLDNFDVATKTFSDLLSTHIPDPKARQLLLTVLKDVYLSYNNLITTEGTFASKPETLRYFISMIAIPTLTKSLSFHSIFYRTFDMGLQTPPEPDWFVPTIASDKSVKWPLQKVMIWIYSELGLSQTQFHYPGKSAATDSIKLEQNLENANNWSSGKTLPSLPALLSNFEHSLDAHKERIQTNRFKSSCLIGLTLARASTYTSRKILEKYGMEELEDLSNQCRNHFDWIEDDIKEFKNIVSPQIERQDYSLKGHAVWIRACTHYWHFLSTKIGETNKTLNRLEQASPTRPYKLEVIEALTSKYGRYAVFSGLDLRQRKSQWRPENNFSLLLHEGLRLKNSANLTLDRIDRYSKDLSATDVENQLRWLEPWIRAVFYYREEKYEESFTYFEKAFSYAQYRAGAHQYKLVNQYVEISAKLDKWQKFKKGVEWATYLRIKIRWLRDDEQTPENLKTVFQILKVAKYPVL